MCGSCVANTADFDFGVGGMLYKDFSGLHCTLNVSVLVFKRQPDTFKTFKPHKAQLKTPTERLIRRPGTQ